MVLVCMLDLFCLTQSCAGAGSRSGLASSLWVELQAYTSIPGLGIEMEI